MRKALYLDNIEIITHNRTASKPLWRKASRHFERGGFLGVFFKRVRPFVCQLYALLLYRADVAADQQHNISRGIAAARSTERYRLFSLDMKKSSLHLQRAPCRVTCEMLSCK